MLIKKRKEQILEGYLQCDSIYSLKSSMHSNTLLPILFVGVYIHNKNINTYICMITSKIRIVVTSEYEGVEGE